MEEIYQEPYITIQGADQGASKKELRRLQTAKSFGYESTSAIEKHEMSTCRQITTQPIAFLFSILILTT